VRIDYAGSSDDVAAAGAIKPWDKNTAPASFLMMG
jgi:hypothetical protein